MGSVYVEGYRPATSDGAQLVGVRLALPSLGNAGTRVRQAAPPGR